MTPRFVSLFSLVAVFSSTVPSQPATRVYATRFDIGATPIYRFNLDGSGYASYSSFDRPKYLAVDWRSSPQKLYIGIAPVSGAGKIVRCNADGSGIEDVVTNLVGVGDIELDLTNRKVFWLQDTYSDDRIFHADMDGLDSRVTQIYATTVANRNLWGLALDVRNQRLWITERGSTCYDSYIRRMSFTGSGVTLVRAPVCNPHDIEYFNGRIVWGERDGIVSANPDGSDPDTLVLAASVYGLTVNGSDNNIYWTDYGLDVIRRVRFDGTGDTTVISGRGEFTGIDVDYNPSAVPVGTEEPLPTGCELFPSYPNPFNEEATIEFHLPAAGDVRLAVLDLLGREVALLVDGRKEGGIHRARFDGSGLASGIYLYRLKAGEFIRTQKMAFVR